METREKNSPIGGAMKTRVFVVDDHPLLRQGIAQLINNESDLEVCGEADNANAALQLIPIAQPDIAVLDISLKGSNGIDLARQVKACYPHVKVLILSMHDETLLAQRAFLAGASGYLTKDEATEKALVAIRRIRDGETYLSKELAARIEHALHKQEVEAAAPDYASDDLFCQNPKCYPSFSPASHLHVA